MRLGVTVSLALGAGVSCASASFCDTSDDGSWVQVWGDEFEGDELDETKWTKVTSDEGTCRTATCDKEDVYIQDGNLVMRSRRDENNSTKYYTGAVWTKGKAYWAHTPAFRMCVSAILPGGPGDSGTDGQGIWPAHWMMPEDSSCDPDEGEMDIMEMISGDGTLYSTYHYQTSWPAANCSYPDGHGEVFSAIPMAADWDSTYHEYAVERSDSHIAFVIDGVTVGNWTGDTGESGDPAVPLLWPVPFHLILNTAVGGSWPGEPVEGTVFPTYHVVDYVRLSQQSSPAE